MPIIKKFVLAILAMALLLSMVSASAGASRSTRSSENTITVLSREVTFAAGFGTVVCEVGMTLALTSNPIAKVAGSRIGTAEVRVLACSRNRAVVVGRAFGVNYQSFEGTLPTITAIDLNLLRIALDATVFGLTCRITANAQGGVNLDGTQRVTTVTGPRRAGAFRLESQRFSEGSAAPLKKEKRA